jgi:hypothetical protein
MLTLPKPILIGASCQFSSVSVIKSISLIYAPERSETTGK